MLIHNQSYDVRVHRYSDAERGRPERRATASLWNPFQCWAASPDYWERHPDKIHFIYSDDRSLLLFQDKRWSSPKWSWCCLLYGMPDEHQSQRKSCSKNIHSQSGMTGINHFIKRSGWRLWWKSPTVYSHHIDFWMILILFLLTHILIIICFLDFLQSRGNPWILPASLLLL